MPKFSTRTLTTMALLTALEIVLSRFLSISAWNTKIGFAFVPVALARVSRCRCAACQRARGA